jgi:putative phosphoribosyl transferase
MLRRRSSGIRLIFLYIPEYNEPDSLITGKVVLLRRKSMAAQDTYESTQRLRILSHSHAPFKDRTEAGQLLAAELLVHRGTRPVVLGIPRGGIIVAREIAHALDGELDIVLSHKLGTPGQPELAMGSIAEDGKLFLNENITGTMGISSEFIESERKRQLVVIKQRAEMIRRVRPKISLRGRVVIVTDDGVATGATTQAALWAVRMEEPERLITAMPVGPEDTIRRISELADEMLCLRTPPMFAAVGQFYERFYPVEDEDMLRILRQEYRSAQGK